MREQNDNEAIVKELNDIISRAVQKSSEAGTGSRTEEAPDIRRQRL